MPKIETLIVPAFTFVMKVEKQNFNVVAPEVTIPQDKVPEILRDYIKVLASQIARYAAVKAAAKSEEFETEVRGHLQMAESLLNRKLTLEETVNIRKRVAEARNFKGADIINVDYSALKSRLNL